MATVQLFSQVASLIDPAIIKAAANKYGTDKHAHTLDTRSHVISMLFCQLADCQSLRDFTLGMKGISRELNHLGLVKAPFRNALSWQNKHRNAGVAREIYMRTREKLMG